MVPLLIAVQWLAGWLPLGVGLFMADRIGDVTVETGRRARGAVASNMRHVLGPAASEHAVRRARREVFRNVVRNYYELLRTSRLSDADLLARFTFDPASTAQLRELVGCGQGVLIATPHWGVFDLLIQALPMLGMPVNAMVARFSPITFVEFISRLRAQRGAHLIWTGEGQAVKKAVAALQAGELVGIAADRNVGSQSVAIRFFGAEAAVAPGLALVALRTGAPIVPTFAYKTARNAYHVRFAPPIYPPADGPDAERAQWLTQQVFSRFEAQIATAPSQWILLQAVWADQPDPAT